jgi:hypothetical protein
MTNIQDIGNFTKLINIIKIPVYVWEKKFSALTSDKIVGGILNRLEERRKFWVIISGTQVISENTFLWLFYSLIFV